ALHRRHRAKTLDLRIDAGMAVGYEPRHRLRAALLGRRLLHEHDRRGRVVDAGRIAGGDGAILLREHRLQLRHAFGRRVGAYVLVGVELRRAFLRLELDGQDLALEVTGRDRRRRALVALHRERILDLAREPALRGDVLRGDAHVHGVEGVGQRADHHVDELGVAHSRAPARRRRRVRRAAHALGAAADRGVDVAEEDVLRRADDRLQAAAAQPVDGERARRVWQPAVDRGDARHVHVLLLGVDDVAEHALADVFRIDLRARNGLAHHAGAELGGRDVLEAAAVVADGGAGTRDDDDFALAHGELLREWFDDHTAAQQ